MMSDIKKSAEISPDGMYRYSLAVSYTHLTLPTT